MYLLSVCAPIYFCFLCARAPFYVCPTLCGLTLLCVWLDCLCLSLCVWLCVNIAFDCDALLCVWLCVCDCVNIVHLTVMCDCVSIVFWQWLCVAWLCVCGLYALLNDWLLWLNTASAGPKPGCENVEGVCFLCASATLCVWLCVWCVRIYVCFFCLDCVQVLDWVCACVTMRVLHLLDGVVCITCVLYVRIDCCLLNLNRSNTILFSKLFCDYVLCGYHTLFCIIVVQSLE